MLWCFSKRFILGCVFALSLPGIVFSAPSDSSWELWLQNQIKQHPDIIAAKEKMKAAFSRAEGRERPIYNPELETEYDREGADNNYLIGVNQTIDFWDKRDTRIQQAGFTRAAARQAFLLTRQQKTAEALQALIQWQGAKQQADLARDQESQLGTLLDLVNQREQAGDLGQVDAEMAFLSLSQRLNATAQALARLKQVEARLSELLPDWSPKKAQIPEKFWATDDVDQARLEQLRDQHPAVASSRAAWEALQQAAELSRREAKADPTLGINAGETDQETVVGLTFSIPLHIRNNFSEKVQAANQEASSAKARYWAARRKQQFAIESARATLREYQQRFKRWQSLMQGRGERSKNLLKKQWTSGDMSTTEYLLALQQRAEGIAAGIELNTRFQTARVDLLLQTGLINAAIGLPLQ